MSSASSRIVPFAVAASVLLLAVVMVTGAMMLPADKGYTIVGTRAFPLMVAALLTVVGTGLLVQALRGHLVPVEGDGGAAVEPTGQRWQAAAWVSCALILDALLIERIGFVAAATVLFALAARGFGSRRWARNIGIGVAIAWPVYVAFTQGLSIGLPSLYRPWI